MNETDNIESSHDKIDLLEAFMLRNLPTIEIPVKHFFLWGYYLRAVFMKKGARVTSLMHKTEHPFFILEGKCKVFNALNEQDGVMEIEAPYLGITKPNTRRVLRMITDVIWVTFHKTDIVPSDEKSEESVLEAVDKIGSEIIEWRKNKVIGAVIKNNEIVDVKQLQHED